MNATGAGVNVVYCDLKGFSASYKNVHGYLSLVVCVFGSVTNLINICVLTTKEMRWPTNFILTGIAVADLLVMLEYIPFIVHNYVDKNSALYASSRTYAWAIYVFFHALFTLAFHFISCCLTVILAIWRYIAISHPQKNNVLCSFQRTKQFILITYIICPLLCSPIYFFYYVKELPQPCDVNGKMLTKEQEKNSLTPVHNETTYVIALREDKVIKFVSYWIYGAVIKLVPCILLTGLSWKLIAALIETKKHRRNLLKDNLLLQQTTTNSDQPPKKTRWTEKDNQTDRTTRMLIAVLLLFLVMEFPQAILGLLSALVGKTFEEQCYVPLGDFMDILALINSGINFVLYCSMSRQFRTTFREIFVGKLLSWWHPSRRQSASLISNGIAETQLSHA